MSIKIVLLCMTFFCFTSEAVGLSQCKDIAHSFFDFQDPYGVEVQDTPKKHFVTEGIQARDEQTNTQNKLIAISKYIKMNGVEKYINASINSEFELVFYDKYLGEVSVLDIAILNGADQHSIDRINYLGYTISDFTFRTLYSSATNRIDLLVKYKDKINLNALKFPTNGKALNIVNYTIFKQDFSTLKYLLVDSNGPNLTNYHDGTLIDLTSLDFVVHAKLTNLIDVRLYKELYKIQINKEMDYQNNKLKKSYKYNYFELIETCVDDYRNLNSNDVLFAISTKELNETFREFDKKNIIDFKIIDEIMDTPLYSEVYSRLYEKRLLAKFKVSPVRTIKDIPSNYSENIIHLIGPYKFLIDEHQLIFNYKGSVKYKEKNIRIDKIAHYISSHGEKLLEGQIEQVKKIKKGSEQIKDIFRFGKNLTYYLFLYSDHLPLLTMYYDISGKPKSRFGLNIIEQLSINSIYDKSSFIKIKFLLKRGYSLNINKSILKILLLNKDFLIFYSKYKSVKGS